MTTKTKTFRQGDVLIEMITAGEIPATATPQPPIGGRMILAHGEATGHHHSIGATNAIWLRAPGIDWQFVTLEAPTQLVHQEHAAVQLEPGTYRVSRQREYSPAAIRNVTD